MLVLTPWYFLALIGRILEAIALGIMFPLYQSALLVITTGDKQKQVMGIENPKLAFEPVIMEAYERRMKEFMDPKVKF